MQLQEQIASNPNAAARSNYFDFFLGNIFIPQILDLLGNPLLHDILATSPHDKGTARAEILEIYNSITQNGDPRLSANHLLGLLESLGNAPAELVANGPGEDPAALNDD